MDSVIQAIYGWIKDILVAGVMDNLICIFDGVNMQVGAVASQVGTSPALCGISTGGLSADTESIGECHHADCRTYFDIYRLLRVNPAGH